MAYFAGGCVRDELLSLTPSDYDVATDATPTRLLSLFRNTREVGAHFGVIHVHMDGCVVEVATFRTDGAYSDNRRPDSVRFSNAPDDAQRRDFTANALFLDPVAQPDSAALQSPLGGTVIDLVRGLPDLKARVLRAVGDPHQRLAEDHLRALRAVRLASKLGFTVEAATADAIRQHASALSGVSRERVGDELRKMLLHPRRAEAIALLRDLALDGPSLTEACLPAHPVATLASLPPESPIPATLAAWALDRSPTSITPADAATVLARWRRALCLSNDEHAETKAILTCLSDLRTIWATAGVAQRKRIAARSEFDWSLTLLRSTSPAHAATVSADVQALRSTHSGVSPAPWVTGDDLIAMGFIPSPRFKALLDRLYDAQLEDRITSRDQAMELARAWSV